METVYKYKCECLINQNLYIEGDPCGHCCYNDADFAFVNDFGIRQFICKKCIDNYAGEENEYEVTIISSIKSQEEIVKESIKRFVKEIEKWHCW